MRALAAIPVLAALAFASPACAALDQATLDGVGATPRLSARVPPSLSFVADDGRRETLAQAMDGRPTVLVFADYTCNYLCGPGLSLAQTGLEATKLKPGADYSLVVVGLDPKDGPAAARAQRHARLDGDIGASAVFLTGGEPQVAAKALGYRYAYDPELDQFAHDTSVFVLSADGRLRRVLPEFALTGVKLADALADARAGRTGDLSQQLRLICYCLQPLSGVFAGPVETGLRIGGAAVVLALALGLVFLVRRRRRMA